MISSRICGYSLHHRGRRGTSQRLANAFGLVTRNVVLPVFADTAVTTEQMYQSRSGSPETAARPHLSAPAVAGAGETAAVRKSPREA
jgi:hypothetical protein